MATESTTMYTYLGYKTGEGTTYTKLVPIKDFPDLGGSPDQVEITTLDDSAQRFLLGVQSMSSLEFTANYTKEDYKTLQDMANGNTIDFCIAFGNASEEDAYGVFTWSGQLSVWVTGGGVNAAREMTISISASTKVSLDETAVFSLS